VKRFLFNTLAGGSFLIFLAVHPQLIRSYWVEDDLWWSFHNLDDPADKSPGLRWGHFRLTSARGGMCASYELVESNSFGGPPPARGFDHRTSPHVWVYPVRLSQWSHPQVFLKGFGFHIMYADARQGAVDHTREVSITVPLWSIAVAAAILPAVWFLRHRKEQRPGFAVAIGSSRPQRQGTQPSTS
jgi:hypothetical protein